MKIRTLSFIACFLFAGVFGIFIGSQTAEAGELRYADVLDVKGGEVALRYRGPWGESFFLCSLTSFDCSKQNTAPGLYPTVFGTNNYLKSHQGNLALVDLRIETAGGPVVYHMLYGLDGRTSALKTIVPVYQPVASKYFTRDGRRIIFFTHDSKALTYDIASHRIVSEAPLAPRERPLLLISHSGRYASSYDYFQKAHRITDLETGTEYLVENSHPSFFMFSVDDTWGVYARLNEKGYHNIYGVGLSDLKDIGENRSVGLIRTNHQVFDILFFDAHRFYYIANSESSPFSWNLYEYDLSSMSGKVIDQDVSYASNLRVAGGKIIYSKVSGKDQNIHAFDPVTGVAKMIEAYPSEGSDTGVSMVTTEISVGRQKAVLLSPLGVEGSRDLFIWLHGGPHRQTSVGMHPYLSYAVYDELLERLVQDGSHVLKLDYTGSFGYGSIVEQAIYGQVGVSDVADVIESISKARQNASIGDVYLIGNSYGGYLALKALVEHPNAISGAISINGVTDWHSLITRIPSSIFTRHFNGTPQVSNALSYMRASIYTKLASISDHRILMVVGQRDATVPTWQTREFYNVLRATGKDVQLISFEDEDHILRKRENLDQLCLAVINSFGRGNVSHCN
jgi:dipeptidyl aminopeptidase/acylaminoacyl peptidase